MISTAYDENEIYPRHDGDHATGMRSAGPACQRARRPLVRRWAIHTGMTDSKHHSGRHDGDDRLLLGRRPEVSLKIQIGRRLQGPVRR